MKNGECWAIVPARAGSLGMRDKNIKELAGTPLLVHSINFAKKLPFVSKVLLSTDSDNYRKVGIRYGAFAPFLRSSAASSSTAMEEDILEDIIIKAQQKSINLPDRVVWLRPTHPFRCIETFIAAYEKYIDGSYSSVCIVTENDPRLFYNNKGKLNPILNEFNYRSMIRRQDCKPFYKIFSGEIFSLNIVNMKKFLGDQIGFVVAPKECSLDIDGDIDFEFAEFLLSSCKENKYARFMHTTC